ncbi:hypothetical protein [Dyadobacter endophyticus]|nr:hypothetical protein [Dyadobacter endophyticus]
MITTVRILYAGIWMLATIIAVIAISPWLILLWLTKLVKSIFNI